MCVCAFAPTYIFGAKLLVHDYFVCNIFTPHAHTLHEIRIAPNYKLCDDNSMKMWRCIQFFLWLKIFHKILYSHPLVLTNPKKTYTFTYTRSKQIHIGKRNFDGWFLKVSHILQYKAYYLYKYVCEYDYVGVCVWLWLCLQNMMKSVLTLSCVACAFQYDADSIRLSVRLCICENVCLHVYKYSMLFWRTLGESWVAKKHIYRDTHTFWERYIYIYS